MEIGLELCATGWNDPPPHGGAATDGDQSFGDTCKSALDRRAATRDRYEPFIAFSRCAICHRRRHSRKRVSNRSAELRPAVIGFPARA